MVSVNFSAEHNTSHFNSRYCVFYPKLALKCKAHTIASFSSIRTITTFLQIYLPERKPLSLRYR